MYGSVRGAEGNLRPYRNPLFPQEVSEAGLVLCFEGGTPSPPGGMRAVLGARASCPHNYVSRAGRPRSQAARRLGGSAAFLLGPCRVAGSGFISSYRRRLVEAALEGTPRGADLLGFLDLDGNPQQAAVTVVTRLAQFGQVAYGQEALGVLLNHIQPFAGDEAAATLADIHRRYALEGPLIPSRPLLDWRSPATVADVSEKIIGENTLRPIHYLELALEAARAVVRLRVPGADGAALGSGFMVAADLLMTNHHVIQSRAQAEAAEYDFNYQLDRDGKPCPVITVSARAGGLFHTQPELDYTVVQLAEPPAFGLPLRLRAAVLPWDARVAIIQHPGGHFKKISLQNNFVAYADNRVVQYFTSTEPGSSGSPVFDDDFAVVAIHHSGGMLEEPGSGRRYLRNAGTSMGAVLADPRQAAPELLARLRR